MAKPKNPPKKNPPKKNVKQRFVDGKLEPFPKRGKPKQNIRKAADSGPTPSNVESCARTQQIIGMGKIQITKSI